MENKDNEQQKHRGWLEPDPETLHTTDPQEHMKGPVSSSVQKVKETVEEVGKDRPESVEKEERDNDEEKK